jgi:hypothetical protein
MMVSDGNFMYRFDGVNWFTMSVPFTYPTHVTYHEGYFFAVEGGTGRVFRSNQFDGSTWEALDFFTAEDKSDNVLALASSNMLWVIGEWTAQPYMHRSSTTAPFYPYQQGRQYYGIIGDTVSVLAGDVVWLARTRDGKATVVIVPKNGELQPMMDDYINTEISQLTTIDDAYSNTLTWQGQNWYILTFPTERRTFVYTGTAWIEWGDFDEQLSRMVEHPMVDAQYFEGVNYFFDDDGILMELRHDVYAHGDNHRICWAESRVYEETGQRVFIHLWELQAATAQGGDATIQLSCSLDGGRTWGNWHPYDMGRDAEWDTRIRWHRLGSGYKFVLRWRISDAVDFSIGPSIINASVKTSLLERRNTRPGGDKWMT